MNSEIVTAPSLPIIEREDRYLNTLLRQPKRDMAEIVRKANLPGVHVPIIYDTLDEATAAGVPFLRSEHPQDYAGASDIVSSYLLHNSWLTAARQYCDEYGGDIDWDSFLSSPGSEFKDARHHVIAHFGRVSTAEFENNLLRLNWPRICDYARATETSPYDFVNAASFSYWEYIDGYNHSVIADSAIAGRYHVISTRNEVGNVTHQYNIVENGQVVYSGPQYGSFPAGLLETALQTTVSAYEQIRNLPDFNPAHCSLMEFQTPLSEPEVLYYLQTHRGTDFAPAQFRLERDPMAYEFEASFCRGATPPEGQVFDVSFTRARGKGIELFEHIDMQEAGCDLHYQRIYSEVMLRRRQMQVIRGDDSLLGFKTSDSLHLPKSMLFKPPLSIVIPQAVLGNLWPGKAASDALWAAEKRHATMRWHVISDGRRAFVRLV